ncbi:FAD-dependent oxidoreductase [Candidatus Solincola tengchongensis]|uniref:NAD(P)/FAD-dependent oxidoreductase n=1 Tax=Candidatus Solincola tengchongensis TaxID=2900693 RepID=UPI00257D18DE|nr:FAD-dependent oxidoreductase [Candidatus Solincola tengchongensis]
MAEVKVVGAGLAGLVAAISLARRGHDVVVLEREERIGGSPLYHPSCQGSPLRFKELRAYLDLDISPGVEPIREMSEIAGGKAFPLDPRLIKAFFFERGPRETSLDSHLYRLAQEAGVEFRFSSPVLSPEELWDYYPQCIVATGLHFEGFDAFGVPYLTSHHFTYRGTCDPDLNFVHMYHDAYTSDYGYVAAFRGIFYVHLFNRRRPISLRDRDRFAEQVARFEGFEVPRWNSFTFPVPAASVRTPRLFAGRAILAGTLSGAMDPFAFFGLQGALVSGKIAALAVEDRERAWREFRRCVRPYYAAYGAARLKELVPAKLNVLGFRAVFSRFERRKAAQKILVESIPGYRNLFPGGNGGASLFASTVGSRFEEETNGHTRHVNRGR